MPETELQRTLDIPNPFGGPVIWRDQTASTMDDAAILAARGLEGAIAGADWQSAGQGRFPTRRWEAAPGDALLFTLVVPRPLSAPGRSGPPVSLILASGLCAWLVGLGLDPRIKWPNDILVDDRKLAGILVVGGAGRFSAGIGINFRQTNFPDANLRRPATSLLLAGITLRPTDALPDILACLRTAFDQPDPVTTCASRLWRRGESVTIEPAPGSPPAAGRIAGLAPDGALLLAGSSGIVRLVSGE